MLADPRAARAGNLAPAALLGAAMARSRCRPDAVLVPPANVGPLTHKMRVRNGPPVATRDEEAPIRSHAMPPQPRAQMRRMPR